MSRHIASFLLVMTLCALPGVVLAYGSTGSSNITSISVDINNGEIVVGGTWGNPDACPYAGAVVIQMGGNYKDLEAALLTVSGKPAAYCPGERSAENVEPSRT